MLGNRAANSLLGCVYVGNGPDVYIDINSIHELATLTFGDWDLQNASHLVVVYVPTVASFAFLVPVRQLSPLQE